MLIPLEALLIHEGQAGVWEVEMPKVCIFLVIPHPLIRELVETRMRIENYEAVLHDEKRPVMVQLVELRPDVVVLDFDAPVGQALLANIRTSREEYLATLPTICLAKTSEKIVVALECGAHHCIRLPLSGLDLIRMVRLSLEERAVAGSSR